MVLECRTLRYYNYNYILCMMNTKAYIQLLCMMNTKAYIQLLCMMNTCMMNTKAYIQLLCMMNTKPYIQLLCMMNTCMMNTKALYNYILCMMNTKAYVQLLCMMMKRTGSKLTDVTKANTLYSCVHLYIQLYYHSPTIHLLMSRYYSHGVTLV